VRTTQPNHRSLYAQLCFLSGRVRRRWRKSMHHWNRTQRRQDPADTLG